MFHELVDINPVSSLTSKRAVVQSNIEFEAFPPMLVPPLISEDRRTFLTFEPCVVEHVLDHVDYSNLFELVPAMWT